MCQLVLAGTPNGGPSHLGALCPRPRGPTLAPPYPWRCGPFGEGSSPWLWRPTGPPCLRVVWWKCFPWEVPQILRVFPREESEGSLKIFRRQTWGSRKKVCLRKILREPSESSLGNTLSILGNLSREHFHHTTLRLDPHFVPVPMFKKQTNVSYFYKMQKRSSHLCLLPQLVSW